MFLDDDEVSAAAAGAAVPAEALELFNSLGYTFVGVALGLFVFLLVRKFLFFLTWRSFRDGPYVPGVHQWRPGNIAGPQWCNVCESIVYGIRSYVVKCDICGMYAHAQCAAATVRFKGVRVARAASRASCRCKSPGVVADLADDRELAPLSTGEHMWVQGNIDPMDTCSVCGLFCGSLLALSGLKCAWCHVRVHDECFQAYARSHKRAGALLRHCDFGRHANLILPPSSVHLRAPPSFSTTSQRALSSVRSAAQKAVTKMSKIRLRRSLPSGGGTDDTLAAPASTGSTTTSNTRRVSYSPASPPASAPVVATFAEPEKPPSKREEADSELPFDVVAPPGDKTPLLVFINSRSGGQMGLHVLRQARRWLNPVQVFDLAHQSPVAPLRLFANIPRLRVLVCGGDGTVGWVLGALDELGAKRPPPVAVLPLGTGNDLARVLGWGSGFSSRESDLSDVLAEVEAAHVSLLDRWRVAIDDKPRAVLNNYLGVGVDAQVALEFHEQRERSPGLFMSQFVNKLWYSQFGAKNFLVRTCAGLPRKMELVCDGVRVRLPEGTEGVIVLNINSYGGGSKLWHDADSDGESVDGDDTEDDGSLSDSARSVGSSNGGGVGLGPSSPHDGLLDVVAVYGTLHLGQLQVGLSRAVRLCQARSVSIHLKETLPVQIDGEPWLQPPSDVDIGFMQQSFMLSRTVQERDVVTKKVGEVLDWAEHARVISARQRDVLLAEIARRVADDNTSGLTKRLRRDNGSLLLAD